MPGCPAKLRCQGSRKEQAGETGRFWGAKSPRSPGPEARVPAHFRGSPLSPGLPPIQACRLPGPHTPAAVARPCGSGSGWQGAPRRRTAVAPRYQRTRCTSASPGCCQGTLSRVPGTYGGQLVVSLCPLCPQHGRASLLPHSPPRTVHRDGWDAAWRPLVHPLHGDVERGGGMVSGVQCVVRPDEEVYVGHLQPAGAADLTRHCGGRHRTLHRAGGCRQGGPGDLCCSAHSHQ